MRSLEKEQEMDLNEVRSLFISVKLDKEKQLDKMLDEREKQILSLRSNWDDNGAEPFTEDTLKRVRMILKEIFRGLWKEMMDIPLPLVQQVPDGSIDINWETEVFELLINIPSSLNELVNFYGEKLDHPEDEIEVRINFNLATKYLIPWLIKVNAC